MLPCEYKLWYTLMKSLFRERIWSKQRCRTFMGRYSRKVNSCVYFFSFITAPNWRIRQGYGHETQLRHDCRFVVKGFINSTLVGEFSLNFVKSFGWLPFVNHLDLASVVVKWVWQSRESSLVIELSKQKNLESPFLPLKFSNDEFD